jgi:hypothetical protein
MSHQTTHSIESHPTTQTLPDIGWLRVRQKIAGGSQKKDIDVAWTPITAGPFLVPITRWI